MKHHEYQIYYGGFKIKLPNIRYCKTCHMIVYTKDRKFYLEPHDKVTQPPKNQSRSHKKRTVKTRKFKFSLPVPVSGLRRCGIVGDRKNVLPKKN